MTVSLATTITRPSACETTGTAFIVLRFPTMTSQRIVAVGLLTQDDLAKLGPTFGRAWPLDEAPCFEGLLEAIDEAERDVRRERDRSNSE